MNHNIIAYKRKRTIIKEIDEVYSVLTCGNCGREQEILGLVEFTNLSQGWSALSLDSQSNIKVFRWLLCPSCTIKVRETAGL